MFILGTSSVLAYFKPEQVDLIGPIAQVLSRGFGQFGAVAAVAWSRSSSWPRSGGWWR